MKMFLSFLAIAMLLVMGHASAQEGSVAEKLNQYKAEFAERASDQKKKDFEQGIKDVEASGVLELAKNKGDKAPEFTLPNALGENVSLSSLLEKGPVVMIWYRGEWCPYCNLYLEDIQANARKFKRAGASIVAISPEKPSKAFSLQDKLDLEYQVLSDDQSKVAKEYGVVYTLPPRIATYYQEAFDLHGHNQDDRNLLPLSASYVIAQDGTITYAYLDADYRMRAETSTLLDAVRKITGIR